MVLHPERDCSGAVGSILDWAASRRIEVLGIDTEIRRLACTAEAVSAEELRRRADLVVSLGGDGTMLRAMRLADRQRFAVLWPPRCPRSITTSSPPSRGWPSTPSSGTS